MKKFVMPLVMGMVLVMSGLGWSGQSTAKLDKKQLREGLASRIEGAIKQKRPQAQVDLCPSDVALKRIKPTSVSIQDKQIPLYAVKANIASPVRNGQASTVRMVVDQSGEHQLSIKNVSNGSSLVQAAKDMVRRKELNKDWGNTVFNGGGSHNVLLVSDPFCGYCRKAVSWFLDHQDSIGELRVMHVPFSKKVGGDVASWAFKDGADTVEPGKLLRFVYTHLEPLEKNATEKDKRSILRQMMEEFPALKEKWGSPKTGYYYLKGKVQKDLEKEARIAQQELEVRATPGVFVNGIPVKGWNPQRYSELLAKKAE